MRRPSAAAASTGGGSGPVGATRSISFEEAYNIILTIHNELGYNLGSRSTREQRVDFLWTAVAVIHFGHPRFNPAGGDPGWCVKSAGGGRPPSDDVLVRCDTRDAWDLVISAGARRLLVPSGLPRPSRWRAGSLSRRPSATSPARLASTAAETRLR